MRITARLRRACDKHDQILRGRARLLADFCRCLWKAFFNTFEIFEQLRSAFGVKERLDVIALFSRKLSNLWSSNRNYRQFAI